MLYLCIIISKVNYIIYNANYLLNCYSKFETVSNSQRCERVYLIVSSLTDTKIYYTKLTIKYLDSYKLLETVEKNKERDNNSKFYKSSVKNTVIEVEIDTLYRLYYRQKKWEKTDTNRYITKVYTVFK